MKKWIKFFCLSFFSDKQSREGAKRGYTNVLIGLALALIFVWLSYACADILPFGAHYNSAPDFKATVHSVLANGDKEKRIDVKIENNRLSAKKHGGEYTEGLLVNTYENENDKENYSVNGYEVVIDTRSASTLAEVRAYCVSNDVKNTEITYEEYLTLSDVAKLNFDFRLEYTGGALILDDALTDSYVEYLNSLDGDAKQSAESVFKEYNDGKISKDEYQIKLYELYFANYYPEISAYEGTSSVPLLRNYYYHEYINKGSDKYLFIFDDYLAGSYETKMGIEHTFYGYYSGIKDGTLIDADMEEKEANAQADKFIKKSFKSLAVLNFYSNAVSVVSFIPFIALMPMVVTLLAYSILKLSGCETVSTMGAAFKIVGSHLWFSGLVSATFTVIAAFFVPRNIIVAVPLVILFITLSVRAVIFSVNEIKLYRKQAEQEMVQTEA